MANGFDGEWIGWGMDWMRNGLDGALGLMGPGSNHLDGLAPRKQDPPAAPEQVHAARLAWLPRAP